MSYIIPPINAKGKFTVLAPYDAILSPIEEYTVNGIRTLKEMAFEDPLNNIYIPAGLTEDDMKEDIAQKVPIVVLLTTAGGFIYIPADRIVSMPNLTGRKYQELALTIPIGLFPVDMELGLIKDQISTAIFESLGIQAVTQSIKMSAVILVDEIDDKKLTLLRENRQSVSKSYKTRYIETLQLLEKKTTIVAKLECFIKKLKGMTGECLP